MLPDIEYTTASFEERKGSRRPEERMRAWSWVTGRVELARV